MARLYNLARMTTATTGTGTLTLGSAVSGFLSFAQSGIADGDTITYAIKDGSNSEIGRGVYTSSGTTLTRNVLKSTNSNSAINLSGTAEVFITAAAEDLIDDWGPTRYSLAVSASASALTIELKTPAGNTPSASDLIAIPFRSATATTSTPVTRYATGATSLTISSGSTMGVTSSTAFRLWVVIFDDAGTLRLGAVNAVTLTSSRPTAIFSLTDNTLVSSTAEGGAGAADSAGVIYTGTAVTDKPYRILGYLEWSTSGLTAGTWTTTNLSIVQLWAQGMPTPGTPTGNRACVVKTDTFTSTTASAYTDITGFNVSITPKSAANMVRVIGGWNSISGGGNVAASQLVRGSTAIDVGDSWAGVQATSTILRTTDAVSINFNGCDYLDNPASTSSTTYKVQFYLQADTYYFNRSITSASGSQPRTSSTISVEEIMG